MRCLHIALSGPVNFLKRFWAPLLADWVFRYMIEGKTTGQPVGTTRPPGTEIK